MDEKAGTLTDDERAMMVIFDDTMTQNEKFVSAGR